MFNRKLVVKVQSSLTSQSSSSFITPVREHILNTIIFINIFITIEIIISRLQSSIFKTRKYTAGYNNRYNGLPCVSAAIHQ